jgi:hypothetical protein
MHNNMYMCVHEASHTCTCGMHTLHVRCYKRSHQNSMETLSSPDKNPSSELSMTIISSELELSSSLTLWYGRAVMTVPDWGLLIWFLLGLERGLFLGLLDDAFFFFLPLPPLLVNFCPILDEDVSTSSSSTSPLSGTVTGA